VPERERERNKARANDCKAALLIIIGLYPYYLNLFAGLL
jgi:hypothetical protein